jgi:MFS family permease
VGALLMGFAVSYAMLMAGRFVAGVGVGYAIMITPVYTTEISPAASRDLLTSFPDFFINLGILLGYLSNYAFARGGRGTPSRHQGGGRHPEGP